MTNKLRAGNNSETTKMTGFKKGTQPPLDRFSLIGGFEHDGLQWFVYRRFKPDDGKFCNLKVIHPKKPKVGSSNIWLTYFMGAGDDTRFIRNRGSEAIKVTHPGLDKAILSFCRDKMPETFD